MARFTLNENEITLDIDIESNNEKEILETIRKLTDKLEELKKKEVKYPIWKELHELEGCYIDTDSVIRGVGRWNTTIANQNTFIDKQHAKSALALAKISQLMPYYGGEITKDEWNNVYTTKYTVVREEHTLQSCTTRIYYEFIAFRTEEYRERFMSRKENERLVRDYYMMD